MNKQRLMELAGVKTDNNQLNEQSDTHGQGWQNSINYGGQHFAEQIEMFARDMLDDLDLDTDDRALINQAVNDLMDKINQHQSK